MKPDYIRFSHFYDKYAYCKLQEYFGSYDYQNRYIEAIKEPYSDFTITNYELDEFSQEEDYKELSFLMDFLYPGINNLSKIYIEKFKNEINNKGLFTKDLIDGFAKHYRNRMIRINKDVKGSEFHNDKTKFGVFMQLRKIEEYVEDFFANPYPNIKNKMQSNWSRTKIIYLFHLLRANKEIAWIEDADIGRIIDNIFEYRDKDNYLPIINSRKHFNAFKNVEGRPEKKVNEELKELFFNDDFYNV